MDFCNVNDALRRELSHAHSQEVYDRARRRTPILSDHCTPLSVLAVMHDENGSWGEKDALTRVLIREQQNAPNEVWTTLLIAAFIPMLRKLRRRVRGLRHLGVDLDELTISCFLSMVGNFDLTRHTHHTCVRLRQGTARAFFGLLTAELRYDTLLSPIDLHEGKVDTTAPWSHLRLRPRQAIDDDERLELMAMIRERISNVVSTKRLEWVLSTALLPEDLRAYVARTCPEVSPAALEREYERLKRRRSRARAELLKILGEDCPRSDPPCL